MNKKDARKYKDSLMMPNLLPFLAFNHGSNFWFIPGVSVPFPMANIFGFVSMLMKGGTKKSGEESRGKEFKRGEEEKNQEGRTETEKEEDRKN